jgi:hypothetical protein
MSLNRDQVLKLADVLDKAASEIVDPNATDLDRVAEGVAAIAGAQVIQKTAQAYQPMGRGPTPAAPQQAARTFKAQRSPVTTPLSASKAEPAATPVSPERSAPGEKTAEEKQAGLVDSAKGVVGGLLGATRNLGTNVRRAVGSHKAVGKLEGLGLVLSADAARGVRGGALKEVGKGLILPGAALATTAGAGYVGGKMVLGSARPVGIGLVIEAYEAERLAKK